MANTYSQIYIHYVFVVKGRDNLIKESFREELQKYMTGIIKNNQNLCIAIYCMPDHTHILVGLNPSQSVSDLARDLKANSSKWINEKEFLKNKFGWQIGFGAFSYAQSQVQRVINYINNQPAHHRKTTFREEYIDFLSKFKIDYKEEYLFEFPDWIEHL